MTPVQVRFTPDTAELSRVQAALDRVQPRASLIFAAGLGALFVLQGILNIDSPRVTTHWLAYVQIVVGVGYVPLLWSASKVSRLRATPSVEMDVTIDDAGITIAHPAAATIPWKQIEAIRDVGEAFVALRSFGKSIPILKRALPDDGNALWESLDAKLTSRRYLVRGTDSRLRISNMAARR